MTFIRFFVVLLFLSSVALACEACSASFNGPATSSAGEPCHGLLDCGAMGCCEYGKPDDGWECNLPGSRSVCSFTGAGIGPGDPYTLAARRYPDAGAR